MFMESPPILLPVASSSPFLSFESRKDPVKGQGFIHRQTAATVYVSDTGQGEAYLVAAGAWDHDAAQTAAAAYGQMAQVLKEGQLEIVQERVFGSLAVWPIIRSVRNRMFQTQGLEPAGPLTFIQGRPPWGQGLSGIVIRAAHRGKPCDGVWTIKHRGRPVGRGWRRQGHTSLILQNLQGLSPGSNGWNHPPHQVRRLLAQANHILNEQGAAYRDVVRTWFYLNDILSWYAAFNQARTGMYREFELLPQKGCHGRKLPSSTGIQGAMPSGASAALDLLAVIPAEKSQLSIRQLSSPGQPEAFTYGSAFSRGALIEEPEVSLVQVSGTAAIDAQGQSLYPNDIRAQIDCTLEKIELLLGQVGATLRDVAAASVFVKQPQHAQVYWERAAARGLQDLPAVVMVADICRAELLFEMDAEVVIKK
jgi:enamine deaminase RidA (YjgF/YER057c/UK114 family)